VNYRHAYHAGNFADVMKHIVLARMIEHLKIKPSPFQLLDLHAGSGIHDLRAEAAERTGEWRDGVGRLYKPESCTPAPLPDAAEALIAPWRKAIASVNDGTRLALYPGSPEIARRLARHEDRLVFNELHPEDHQALAERFRRDQGVRVLNMDAWTAVRALLPPPERRGLVLLDPPYEFADEVQRALTGLADAYRRIATGILCLWYPVKAEADANALARRAAALRIPKMLRAEMTVRRANSRERLNGSGLIVVNPPWTLYAQLATVLPALAERLADRTARFPGGWRLDWLVGE
jgi:23S rRNA (adenine2030-N6)-methyltransferase